MGRLPEPITDLTLPGPGSRAVRALLSRALLQAHAVVRMLSSTDPADPRAALVRALPGLDAGFVLSALRRPSRLTLARCLMYASPSEAPALGQGLAAALCLDAAEVGALAAAVSFAGGRALTSERSGWVCALPAGSEVTLAAGRIELRGPWGVQASELPATVDELAGRLPAASVSRAHVPLWGEAVLLLHDSNPLAELEAHPAKSGNRVDLGGHAEGEWVEALRGALGVIEEHLPTIADEMKLLLGHVGPVGYFAEQHLSASYLEAMGVVYLSLHPHRMTLVEALVHEFQHNKLNLLLGLDATLENAEWPLFSSPVRPDPRPLRGVLLAVHAFQPIAHLYERLCEQNPEGQEAAWLRRRLGEVARLCHEGCEVLLPNARVTPAGRPLFDEIARLDQRFARYL